MGNEAYIEAHQLIDAIAEHDKLLLHWERAFVENTSYRIQQRDALTDNDMTKLRWIRRRVKEEWEDEKEMQT